MVLNLIVEGVDDHVVINNYHSIAISSIFYYFMRAKRKSIFWLSSYPDDTHIIIQASSHLQFALWTFSISVFLHALIKSFFFSLPLHSPKYHTISSIIQLHSILLRRSRGYAWRVNNILFSLSYALFNSSGDNNNFSRHQVCLRLRL